MSQRTIKHVVVLGIVGVFVGVGPTNTARAAVVVNPGFDLFESVQPTTFAGVSWEGVPLGTFDFGGTIGVQNTGTTDTIVQRLDPASVPSAPPSTASAPIPIELVELQLVSVAPIDLGAGLDFHYITLDTISPSTGEMTITFDDANGGIFSSFLDVDFDVRIGGLNGPIILSDILQLSSSNVPWGRIAPPGALTIPGVNHLLNGVDNATDFWPAEFTEVHPTGAQHSVVPGTPEPGSLALVVLGGLMVVGRRRPAG